MIILVLTALGYLCPTQKKVIGDIEGFVSFEILQKTSIERSLEDNVLRQGKIGLNFQLIFEESNVSPEARELLRKFEECPL